MTPTQAIKAKCIECIYDPKSPGHVLEQVARCTSYSCPLYELRPKSAKQKRAEKAARDATLTVEQLAARKAEFNRKIRGIHD